MDLMTLAHSGTEFFVNAAAEVAEPASLRLDLTGNWLFQQVGAERWHPATVPGCNFTDLFANGLIPDPMQADHETQLQWIEREDWRYQLEFQLSAAQLQSHRWQLEALGLDTFADIYLNGQLLASTDNMFVGYQLDCQPLLVAGNNLLEIYFHSPINKVKPQQLASGMVYPAENDKSDDKLSVYVRKAPCHFGWDWGPRFVSSGIWRGIALVGHLAAKIDDLQFTQLALSSEAASLQFDLDLTVLSAGQYQLQLQCSKRPELKQCVLVDLAAGAQQYQWHLDMPQPELWWPAGLGEAFLYPFSVAVYDANSQQLLAERSLQIGLRTVEVINENDADGQSFYFKVNGLPVFMKGANYIPASAFPGSLTAADYQREFAAVSAAGMNMLRVWGGGFYQDEQFYQLADQHGVLIWQDFMFACSLYPGDADFLANVEREARYNIKRLRNHPCLAMWCGNNEVDMGIARWDWPQKFGYSEALFSKLKQDYCQLFGQLLPGLVKQLDGDRFYLRSSPISFWEDDADHLANHHFWGVWHGEQPFSEYQKRIPRFMSEYGFQSFPLQSSVDKFLPQAEQRLDSAMLTVHQKHPRGNKLIQSYLAGEFHPPKDFEQLLYLSQVQQALGLKLAFDAHRAAMPFCMGTLYWQLNDTWPAASWSGIDYYGRWKALHYQAARSFRPQSLVFAVKDEQLTLTLISDSAIAFAARLQIRLLDFSGTLLLEQQRSVSVCPLQAKKVEQWSLAELTRLGDDRQLVLHVQLVSLTDGLVFTDNLHFFRPHQQLCLQSATADVQCSAVDGLLQVRLQSQTLLRQVLLELPDQESTVLNFSDNFIDLLANEPAEVTLALPGQTPTQILALAARLRVQSLVDSYQAPALHEQLQALSNGVPL
jgi:beta-mannosidase